MEFDSSNETHPLENFPPTSAAVADIYTAIPYQKGASVLRMTSNFLTEDVFELAIKNYINRHQYQSAEQNDVFDELQEELNKYPLISEYVPSSVREIMNSWCQQSKFPLIRVSRSNASQIILTQEEISDEGPTNSTTTWWVPVNLQPRSRPDLPGTVPDTWIPQGVSSITVDVIPGETVVVNPEGIGYYQVLYDESMQNDILAVLKGDHTKIPSTGRSKLISDSFQLAFAGYMDLEAAMEFTKYIHNDISNGVWESFQRQMDKLLNLLGQLNNTETADLLKIYLTSKISNVWNSLDQLNIKVGTTGMLLEKLSRWSCDLGSCQAFSSNDIDSFIENPKESEITKEQQFSMYCIAVAQNSSVFDYILAEYMNPETLFGRKQRLLKALPCTTDSKKMKWLVNSIFAEETRPFSIDDRLELMIALAKKAEASAFLWQKIRNNLTDFYKRYDRKALDVLSEIVDKVTEMEKDELVIIAQC
ncbi:unnamed protein product [Orchesella dallaii]|uniref:Aminopeptidase N n=1 Tax=Orchesella dallaii TaxID=48710 RepID=A0ABP1PYZ6_9HEXA